mgnify:CR=1 FL=1
MGNASEIWEKGSGGVIIAAKTKDKTIAYFRNETSWLIDRIPNLTHKSKTTGSWKARPKAKMNVIIKERYSFILAWRVILIRSDWDDWKLKKKFHAIGEIK